MRTMPPQPTPVPDPNNLAPGGSAKGPHNTGWIHLRQRARTLATIFALFIFLVLLGAGGSYFYFKATQKAPASPKNTITNLTPEDIAKLGQVGTNLGSSGQTLNIGADALFRNTVNIIGDTTVGGGFTLKGTGNLNGLNLTGPAAGTSLNLSSNLNVGGSTALQQSLSVAGLATFGSGINVSGNASVNALNAASISVRNLAISGPLTIAHLVTQGPAPTLVTGAAVGAGGTGSLSGNDTAGTLNFNTGSNSPAGVLGAITFRATYTAGVHVVLSPISASAATTSFYTTSTSGGFQVHAVTPPPSGSTVSFDYLITQ